MIKQKLLRNRRILVSVLILMVICIPVGVFGAISLNAVLAEERPDSEVRLNWSSVGQAVYYNVLRDASYVDSINVNIDRDFLGYTDTGLEPSTKYTYKVIATDQTGVKIDESNNVEIWTNVIKRPKIMGTIYDVNTKEIEFYWNYTLPETHKLIIKNANNSVMATVYGTDGVNSVEFEDNELVIGTSSNYTAVAVDGNQNMSDPTGNISVLPIAQPRIEAVLVEGGIRLSWTADTKVYGFKVEKSKYSEVNNSWGDWEVAVPFVMNDGRYWIDRNTTLGLFRYRLKIFDNDYSGYSNTSVPVRMLEAPASLTGELTEDYKFNLTWDSGENPAAYIKVYRGVDNEGLVLLKTIDGSVETYKDMDNLMPNRRYYYRLVAYENAENFAVSSDVELNTNAPIAPSNLISLVSDEGLFTLRWDDNANNENEYVLEYMMDNGYFSELKVLSANTEGYVLPTLENEKIYSYRIKAINLWGESNYSNIVTFDSSRNISMPIDFEVELEDNIKVKLTWDYPQGSDSDTSIERREVDGDGVWKRIAVLESYVKEYIDKDVKENTKYLYRINGVLGNNVYSQYLPEAGEEILIGLKAPGELSATRVSNSSTLLRWRDNSDETGFVVEKSIGSGSFQVAAEVGRNVVSWRDNDAPVEIEMTYRVYAIRGSNVSDYSNESKIDVVSVTAPYNILYQVEDTKKLTLNWECDYQLATFFVIEKRKSSSEEWAKVGQISAKEKVYSENLSGDSNSIYYRVGVVDDVIDETAYSEEFQVYYEKIEDPSDLQAKSTGYHTMMLNWLDNSDNEDGFLVYRWNGKDYVEIAKLTGGISYYEDRDLLDNTKYFYRVKAYQGANLYSGVSNTANATTQSLPVIVDLAGIDWARDSIQQIYKQGIVDIKSLDKNRFNPNDNVKRADFVSMLVRAFNITYRPVNAFKDIDSKAWYYQDVMKARASGIVVGDEEQRFEPNRSIKREEIAMVITRALNKIGKPLKRHPEIIISPYKDKNEISTYAKASVISVVGEGILKGKSDSVLDMKGWTTKAEAAVIIERLIKKFMLSS